VDKWALAGAITGVFLGTLIMIVFGALLVHFVG
jgi:hypothetical protein